MRRRLLISMLPLLLLGALIAVPFGSQAQKGKPSQHIRGPRREKAITLQGTFLGFEVGDYMHAILRDSRGRSHSFYLYKPGMEYFLSMHKDKQVVGTYETVKVRIPEAGGVVPTDRLTEVKAGGASYTAWWKGLKSKSNPENLEGRFGSLVKAATLTK